MMMTIRMLIIVLIRIAVFMKPDPPMFLRLIPLIKKYHSLNDLIEKIYFHT